MIPYKVLVVDDSAFMRKIFSDLIEKDPAFQVMDTAENGREAVEKIARLKPDVVTMDVEMPEMNGLEALKQIMAANPLPVIMLSGINEEGMKETIMALESGAFDFIRKPSATFSQHIDQVGDTLLEQLKAAMSARERRAAFRAEEEKRRRHKADAMQTFPGRAVIPKSDKVEQESLKRQTPILRKTEAALARPELRNIEVKKSKPASPPTESLQETVVTYESASPAVRAAHPVGQRQAFTHLVAIGCSTGGPRALKAVLEKLPVNFPAPVVIVQHMPPNFTKSLAQRLNSFSPLEVVEAEDGMVLNAGYAYVAPGGRNMRVARESSGCFALALSGDEPKNGHRPSVDVLFESLLPLDSLVRHAVLMTGMGSDGARMMKRLYDAGVSSTFAESEETCIVYGMPRSAIELQCVSHVLPLHEIAAGVARAVK
ncbi:chemotaxis response regulator protein-glutamate methylesterase [Paenibacillus sp.]|jgi:two-component system chemotaxis response regulator CheB|uniref:protein-glutamate methylesterase/protein-glutamine glutaminase n=1 Tax=Paenibacillus sp. TaxID=58172 RepID=UPI002829B8DE|nr:chemotaxis response regulator protein-glutamate methylesterase [Paenibacillus sp.]MDR0270062.1 chemotaxis response regulator protein-glutamate methylesterase [Paenibacillus sp.]